VIVLICTVEFIYLAQYGDAMQKQKIICKYRSLKAQAVAGKTMIVYMHVRKMCVKGRKCEIDV
jgi:hypothetical protein